MRKTLIFGTLLLLPLAAQASLDQPFEWNEDTFRRAAQNKGLDEETVNDILGSGQNLGDLALAFELQHENNFNSRPLPQEPDWDMNTFASVAQNEGWDQEAVNEIFKNTTDLNGAAKSLGLKHPLAPEISLNDRNVDDEDFYPTLFTELSPQIHVVETNQGNRDITSVMDTLIRFYGISAENIQAHFDSIKQFINENYWQDDEGFYDNLTQTFHNQLCEVDLSFYDRDITSVMNILKDTYEISEVKIDNNFQNILDFTRNSEISMLNDEDFYSNLITQFDLYGNDEELFSRILVIEEEDRDQYNGLQGVIGNYMAQNVNGADVHAFNPNIMPYKGFVDKYSGHLAVNKNYTLEDIQGKLGLLGLSNGDALNQYLNHIREGVVDPETGVNMLETLSSITDLVERNPTNLSLVSFFLEQNIAEGGGCKGGHAGRLFLAHASLILHLLEA